MDEKEQAVLRELGWHGSLRSGELVMFSMGGPVPVKFVGIYRGQKDGILEFKPVACQPNSQFIALDTWHVRWSRQFRPLRPSDLLLLVSWSKTDEFHRLLSEELKEAP